MNIIQSLGIMTQRRSALNKMKNKQTKLTLIHYLFFNFVVVVVVVGDDDEFSLPLIANVIPQSPHMYILRC